MLWQTKKWPPPTVCDNLLGKILNESTPIFPADSAGAEKRLIHCSFHHRCMPMPATTPCARRKKPSDRSIQCQYMSMHGQQQHQAWPANRELWGSGVHPPSQNNCTCWLLQFTFDHSSYLKKLYKYYLFCYYIFYHHIYFKYIIIVLTFAQNFWIRRMVKRAL
jgi:hypothetical protein